MSSPLLTHWRFLWLILASLLAGIMNAMAGGGSFISFPAFLGMGILPIEANATNTVALWPGQLTSFAALHGDLRLSLLPVVLSTAIFGGICGAEVLLHTRQLTFLHLIPWLLLIGALLFGVSGPVSRWLRSRSDPDAHHPEPHINLVYLFLGMFPVCAYIGYFGAGSGFLVLTVLSLFGMQDMHQLTAVKIITTGTANLFAIFTFILRGRIVWHDCLVAMVAAAFGGFIGARYTRRMNQDALRAVVVITGVTMAGYFFWREH